jgi:hypothetical protein
VTLARLADMACGAVLLVLARHVRRVLWPALRAWWAR